MGLATAGEISPQTRECIQKCDAALAAKDVHIEKLNLGLTESRHLNEIQSTEIKSLNGSLSSPIRNPFIMITVGVVVGILVTSQISK